MKKTIFTAALVLLTSSTALAAGEMKERRFTAYNMWHGSINNIHSINYQVGTQIPAGTEVKKVVVQKEEYDPASKSWLEPKVSFTLANGKSFDIFFNSKYHPGMDMKSIAERAFTTKSLEERGKEFTADELDAITRGAVVRGMRKEAVLVSYGFPPEHETSSLKSNQWRYWVNRFKSKNICFDGNERAIACEELRANDL